MNDLHNKIRDAQIRAGENVVIDNLLAKGLVSNDDHHERDETVEGINKKLEYVTAKAEYYKKQLMAIENTFGHSDKAENATIKFIAKNALKEYP